MSLKNIIFRDLKLSLLLSSILGITFVFPYKRFNKISVKISQLSKIINILFISTYSFCLIYFCINFEIYKENKYYHLPIIKQATMYLTIGNSIYFYLVYISAFSLSYKLKYIIEKFHELDCTLYNIKKCTDDDKTNYNLLLLLLSTNVVYAILTISISIMSPNTSVAGEFKILWIIFYYPVIIEVIIETQYAFLIYFLYHRIAFIREIVHHLFNSEEGTNNTLKQKTKSSEIIYS